MNQAEEFALREVLRTQTEIMRTQTEINIKLRKERDALKEALQGVMECYVGERNSKNVIGMAGVWADKARATLALSKSS